MSLDHILLGILRKPANGYAIKQAFDEVFNHFWAAKLSQIYRTLKRLEEQGALTSRNTPSEKGPDKRIYSITAKGRRQLRDWLAQGPVVGEERFAYLGQVFFLSELKDLRQSLEFMSSLEASFRRQHEVLRAVEAHWRSSDPGYPDALNAEDFHAQLTLQMGLAKTAALLKWAEQSVSRIRKRLEENKL